MLPQQQTSESPVTVSMLSRVRVHERIPKTSRCLAFASSTSSASSLLNFRSCHFDFSGKTAVTTIDDVGA